MTRGRTSGSVNRLQRRRVTLDAADVSSGSVIDNDLDKFCVLTTWAARDKRGKRFRK